MLGSVKKHLGKRKSSASSTSTSSTVSTPVPYSSAVAPTPTLTPTPTSRASTSSTVFTPVPQTPVETPTPSRPATPIMAAVQRTESRSEPKMPAVTKADPRPENRHMANSTSSVTRSERQQNATSSTSVTRSGTQEITIVKETTSKVQLKLQTVRRELGSSVDDSFSRGISMEDFFDYVAAERLRHLPARGSRWDKVLKWAELFACQVIGYHKSVASFVSHSHEASRLVWSSCRSLLQMGHDQAIALEKAFGVFYNIGLALSFFRQNENLFNASGEIRQSLGNAFADMLTLVVDVVCFFQKKGQDMSGSILTADFDSLFGRNVDSFFTRRDQVANGMWTYKLQQFGSTDSTVDPTVDIRTIRTWLAPQDRILKLLSTDRMGIRATPSEFTCEWFQSRLQDYTRSKDCVLAINGGPGFGKSYLARWIVERLQRPLGRKSYSTISYAFDVDVPSSATSLNLVKSLLLQLLEQSVGNIDLYKSLVNVFKKSAKFGNAAEVESALWVALDTAFAKTNNLVVVVDGLDEVNGGDATAIELFGRLHELTAKHGAVRTITLSRPLGKPLPNHTREFQIDASHTREDMRHFILESLTHYHHYHDQSHEERERIVEQIIRNANGSFLWADLTLESLKKEQSHSGFTNSLNKAPISLADTIQKILLSLDPTKSETRLILSWLITAVRPLSVAELESLLEIDVSGTIKVSRATNIRADIHHSCGSLVSVRDGLVRFRHASIRQHLLDLSKYGKTLVPYQDAQLDITTRILAYAKLNLIRHHKASIQPLEPSIIKELFQTHSLLEYTIRYWTAHFRSSSLFQTNGSYTFSPEFKSAFPNSTLMALIEASCWEPQTSTVEAVRMHILALQIRQHALKEICEPVLQCYITIALTYDRLSDPKEASRYYYQAIHLSRTITSKYSSIAIFCATSYLTCTQALTTNTRTDVTTHREETLKFIIETQQHQHGTVNEATIKYKTLLAELYVQIKEIQSAMSLYREVYDSSVELYGASSREVVGISEAVSGVQQQETVKGEEIQSLSSIFEIAEQTMSITDIRRINISILMAEMHESHKQLIQAEEIYVTLWRRISEECRLRSSVESHEKKLEVTLRYVKFLLKHHRHAEAESILRGVWTEYEHESLTSEVMVLRLKQVGQLLKDMGIFAVALSIFSSVWSYFKRTKKETSSEARSSAILLIETFEIVEVTEELCIDTSIYESVLSDVIETSISSSTIKKIDITTVRSCEVISIYYTRREMWAAALKVCDNHLHVMWPSLRSGHIKELPKEFRQESINIAMRLAYCELREGHVETAEQLYRHIFQETRSTPHVHIDLIDETGKALASFYEESKQHDKVIAVYKELLEEYRKHHGHTHHHSIEILYLLGDLCMKYNHKDADRYYLEIVTALNKSSEVCHIDAVRAASLLSKYYYEHKRWTELHRICSTLWITITKRGKEYKMSSELVETIYQRYSYVLEKEIKVEYSVLRQITIEYRETCVKLFGAHAEITIKATLRLAEICESNTKYQQEAIKIYEEVSRTTTTEKNASIIGILMIAKQRLAGLYIKSNTNTQGALTLYQESYEHARNRHGCSHKSTLSKLGEFVMVCKERNDQQWALTATRTLQSSTIEVISVEKNSEKLFEAAVSIATAYLTCGYREQGFELLRELRRQIIFKDMRSSEKFGFKIDQSVERRAYVFLIAFDETLKGNKKISFSEVMADLLTETFLYENYNRSLKQDSSFDKTIVHGSRLHSFLTAKQRQDQITLYEDQLHELFLKNMGTSFKVSRHATRVFIVILLQHLGETKTHVELDNAACVAGNDRVLSLLEQSKFQEAYELAICVYYFVIHQHNGYAQGQNLINGFKLSLYMAGRGTKRCPDQALRSQMMDLSKTILHKIMQSARHTKFGFVKRDPVELNELAGLMGEQQNWDDLEWLLTELWGSRHTQNTWSAATIVWIGRRLVEIRFSHKERRHSAIHLCEDICYNMRRVWGPLDRTTIEMYNLLSRLYTTEKRFTDAMVIHEEILRHELDSEEELGKDDAATSRKQLELLKRSYQRNGGWDKDPKIYSELYRQLSQVFEHERDWQGVQSVERWNAKAPTDSEGTFTTPTSWEFMDAAEEKVKRRNLLGCIGENGHCGDEELEDILIAPSKAETKKSPVYQNGHGMKV